MPSYKKYLVWYIVFVAACLGAFWWYASGFTYRSIIASEISKSDSPPGVWSNKASLPITLVAPGVTALGDALYVSGGLDALGQPSRAFLIYDSRNDHWEELSPLPAPIHHAPLVTTLGLLYSIGGFDDSGYHPTSTVLRYDPATHTWTTAAPLPVARGAIAAVAYGNFVYVFGGLDSAADSTNEVFIYDPATDRWSPGATMPVARMHAAAVAARGGIYIIGGSKQMRAANLQSIDRYDPVADSWSKAPPLPDPRAGVSAIADGDRVFIFGGENDRRVFDRVDVLDPQNNKWTRGRNMTEALHDTGIAIIEGVIHLLGGSPVPNHTASDTHLIFKP